MESQTMRLNLSKTYLLSAKANAMAMRNYMPIFEEERLSVVFGLYTGTVLLSYMAIEAYIRGKLYAVWQMRKSSAPNKKRFYGRFLEKYEPGDGFRDMKRLSKEKEGLLFDIKSLCFINGVTAVSDVDTETWDKFKDLLRKHRHFVVHPDPIKFSESVCSILKTDSDTYPETASKLIAHFYRENGEVIPKWLSTNNVCIQNGRFVLLG
jgi:hypothetical protein